MASSSTLSIKVLTPSGSVFNNESTMVILPGVTGEVGILPGHVPMIFRLDPGMLKVYYNEKLEYTTFIFGGFAKIHQDQLYVLVDKVCKLEELDYEDAKNTLEDLEKKILDDSNAKLLDVFEYKIRTARKILELAKPKH